MSRRNRGAGARRGGDPVLAGLLRFVDLLRGWLELLARIGSAAKGRRSGRSRPWRMQVTGGHPIELPRADVERLLKQHRDLDDLDKIAGLAGGFRLPESDYFADAGRVELVVRVILEESPPWLLISRVLSGAESAEEATDGESLERERKIRTREEVTLFVPDEEWRDKPLASLTMRPARSMNEVWQARLLDQVLPPEVLLDRCNRGEIMVPVRERSRQRLDFRAEHRTMEVVRRLPIKIPVEQSGASESAGQLLYFLLDASASMQGLSATLAMAVIAATLRANMGSRNTRYLFRAFAETIWPPVMELPIQARTLGEKDRLFDTVLKTNFNGEMTHVNDALAIVATDVRNLRAVEDLDASILLVTDGRAEIWESTALGLRQQQIKVHTVMVTPEPNPGLAAISESYSVLHIDMENLPKRDGPLSVVVSEYGAARRSLRI